MPELSRAARTKPRRPNRAAPPWPSRATLLCPTCSNSCSCSCCTIASAATVTATATTAPVPAAATATMATPSVLTFDAEGRPIKDQFLALSPTDLTVDLLEKELLAAEKSIVVVGASRGDPRSPFFAGCSPSPLLPSIASAATVDYLGAEGRYSQHGGSGGGGTCPYVIRTGDRTGQNCRRFHTAQRCFFRLDDAWREQFPDATELPRWADLLRKNIDIFALDFDAILGAMHALTCSVEGDCYLSVPPDPGIGTSETAASGASASVALGPGEAAALGTRASTPLGPGEAAALGASESAPPGASASALAGTASTEALHTFTLDSGASRCFFRDRTALEQLARPVAVSLADPSGGPVLATSSTVLPCLAVPSGTLSGLYLPSFSTNLVAGFALQDGGVHHFTLAYERVTHCTCARTGRHLATFTRQPGSYLYTLTNESPQVAASASASVQRLRGMHSRYLVSGLPRVLPPLPPSPAPPCLPCVEGRQRATPHSSSFPPTEAPLQTLHLDVWGPARVRGQGHERYFLLVVDDYTRYTTVFPLRTKGEVPDVLIPWIRAARLQLRDRFQSEFPVLRLHSDRGVQYAAHQLNLWPRVSAPETSPTLLWTGQVGDAPRFRVWGAHAFVRDTTTSKLSARAVSCVFLGFVPDAPGWQFYHPTLRRVIPSQDVTLTNPLPHQGPAPSGVSQVDAIEPIEVVVDSGPERGTELGGTETGGAEPGGAATGGAEPWSAATEGAETGGAGTGGAEPGGAEPRGTEPGGVDPGGAPSSQQLREWYSQRCGLRRGATGAASTVLRLEPPSPQRLREWYAQRCSLRSGAPSFELPPAGGLAATGGAAGATGGTGAAGGATSTGPAGGTAGAARGPGVAGGAAGAAGGTGAAGGAASTGPAGGAAGATGGPGVAGGAAGAAGGTGTVGAPSGAPGPGTGGAAGVGATGGTGVDTPRGATGAVGVGVAAGGSGAVSAGSGGTSRPRPYFVPLLQQVLGQPPPPCPAPSLECLSPVQLQSQLQPTSPLPGPSPYTGPTGGLTEHREPESCPVSHESHFASPIRAARTGRRVQRQRPPAVPGTHQMLLRLSTAPQRVPLPSPPASSLPALADPESDSLRATSPTVTRLLPTVVTDPSFESAAASALFTELVDFAAHCRLDYAASLVAESGSVCPPSIGGECALSTDVPEDRQEEFECFAAAVPHLVSMLIAPEGDSDAPDIPTPRFYAEAIAGFSQREGVDFFQNFSPTPKMTTLRVLLHVATQRDYELHSLDFSTAFLQGSLHEEIWLRRPRGFTRSFPAGTQWSLRRPIYGLRQAPHLGELTSYLGLRITRDRARCTITLTQSHMVQQVLQRFGFTWSSAQTTPPATGHSLSAPPSDESVEPSGPYPELVGCLMYLMTCTRPDLAYPLGLLARYVAPGRHRKVHMDAAKRVLRYLCSTSGMGLVLGGRHSVVLTGHSDASWVDDQATQRSSQGYTFSLGSGSVSWRSTRSSSVLSSSCEAEIYATAMAAQEQRRLTYLKTDLGERPSSPPVLYVDNKAAIALCEEHRLEHRTKHIALHYFLARELQQRGQLRLRYVATRANTADIFTKALQPGDHQRFYTVLGLVPTFPHLL
ncbi:unnamed protein product [Closterium sp. NIES-54]